MVISGKIGLDTKPLFQPENTLEYYVSAIIGIFLIVGIGGLVLFSNQLEKIKEKFGYNLINITFIHIYEALFSYHDFLFNNSIAGKNNSITYLKKGFKIIENWDYGDIPLISDELKVKIDFLKNDFKDIIMILMMSNENEKNYRARELLIKLSELLLYKDDTILDAIYSVEEEYEDLEIPSTFGIMSIYNKIIGIIPIIRENPTLQHIVVLSTIIVLGALEYYIGVNKFNISVQSAYTNAWIIGSTLLAGYFVVLFKKQ